MSDKFRENPYGLEWIKDTTLNIDSKNEVTGVYFSEEYDDIFVRYKDDFFPLYYIKTKEHVLRVSDAELSLLSNFMIKRYLRYLNRKFNPADITFKNGD